MIIEPARGARSTVRVLGALAGITGLALSLAGCGTSETVSSTIDPKYGVSPSERVVAEGQPVPKGGGGYKVGKPYMIAGKRYVPEDNPNYVAEGTASWYGSDFHGRKTANGEIFDMNSISAAHTTLPLPSYVRVTNLSNKRSIIVRVNNRGPFHGDRIIDLSRRTAELLGFAGNGVAKVRLEYVGKAPLNGSDDKKLVASLRQDGTPAELPGNSAVMVAEAKPFVPQVAPVMPRTGGANPLPAVRPEETARQESVAAAEGQAEEAAESEAAPHGAPAPKQIASAPAAPAKPAPRQMAAQQTAPSSTGSLKPAASTKSAAQAATTTAAQTAAPSGPPPAPRGSAPAPVSAFQDPSVMALSPTASGWSTGPAPVQGIDFQGVSSASGTR